MSKDKKNSLFFLLFQIWSRLKTLKKIHFILIILLMIFASIAELISIGMVIPFLSVLTFPEKIFENNSFLPLINYFNFTDANQLMFPITMIFIISILLSNLIRIQLLWQLNKFGYLLGADLSVDIYKHTLYKDFSKHISTNSSEVIGSIVNKTVTIVNYVIIPILNIISATFLLSFILIALIIVKPIAALICIVVLGIFYFFIVFFTKTKLNYYGQIVNTEQNQVVKKLQEGLGSIRDIIIDGTQNYYLTSYAFSEYEYKKSLSNIEIIRGTPRFVIEALGMIIISLYAYSLSDKPGGLIEIIPFLGAIALASQRVLPILQLVYSGLSAIQSGVLSLQDTLALLNEPIDINKIKEKKIPLTFKNHIVLKNLKFRYNIKSPHIINGINLKIAKGSRVGIVGTTGCGKTTLLDIIMGLLKPSEGVMLIDDLILNNENRLNWQSNISHVPQNIFLADCSIMENIAIGESVNNIDTNRVYEASKIAQIHSVIENLEHKYTTKVGERGVKLSGGQRQRIGIARAIYKKSKLIIFDEATNSLDSQTENKVMDSIQELDNEFTIIMVSHRKSSLSNCTVLIEIENGIIKKNASFENFFNIKN